MGCNVKGFRVYGTLAPRTGAQTLATALTCLMTIVHKLRSSKTHNNTIRTSFKVRTHTFLRSSLLQTAQSLLLLPGSVAKMIWFGVMVQGFCGFGAHHLRAHVPNIHDTCSRALCALSACIAGYGQAVHLTEAMTETIKILLDHSEPLSLLSYVFLRHTHSSVVYF